MNKTYTLTSKQAAEQLAITAQDVNKKALKGELTRERKDATKKNSPWLYSQEELDVLKSPVSIPEEETCNDDCACNDIVAEDLPVIAPTPVIKAVSTKSLSPYSDMPSYFDAPQESKSIFRKLLFWKD